MTWPWNYYTDGHAWVCDGYVHWSDCSVSMLALYMNWGWSGNYNGLYAFNNFNPSTYTFNYKSGAVVGIRKP
ncbi:C10 family peptidase [Flavobacterium branchiophilum]|uniref:C10 family peptidase n=1 Tax=Flavobacterium branchiophilum TaxID=55197 RepID=UPI000B5B7C94|nr:C10 family peptidase [Flavobacterium branchiophilum]